MSSIHHASAPSCTKSRSRSGSVPAVIHTSTKRKRKAVEFIDCLPNVKCISFSTDEKTVKTSIKEIRQLLNKSYPNYRVFNLAEKPLYRKSDFDNRVSFVGWAGSDHRPPTLKHLYRLTEKIDKWVSLDDDSVAVIHCRSSKARASTAIAAFLVYKRICETAEDAFRFLAEKHLGLKVASQIRCVKYITELFRNRKPPTIITNPRPLIGKMLVMTTIPEYSVAVEIVDMETGKILIDLRNLNSYSQKKDINLSSCNSNDTQPLSLLWLDVQGVIFKGDVLIRAYHITSPEKKDMAQFLFRCGFHTDFIDESLILTMKNGDIDGDTNFGKAFRLELHFDSPPQTVSDSLKSLKNGNTVATLAPGGSTAGGGNNLRHSNETIDVAPIGNGFGTTQIPGNPSALVGATTGSPGNVPLLHNLNPTNTHVLKRSSSSLENSHEDIKITHVSNKSNLDSDDHNNLKLNKKKSNDGRISPTKIVLGEAKAFGEAVKKKLENVAAIQKTKPLLLTDDTDLITDNPTNNNNTTILARSNSTSQSSSSENVMGDSNLKNSESKSRPGSPSGVKELLESDLLFEITSSLAKPLEPTKAHVQPVSLIDEPNSPEPLSPSFDKPDRPSIPKLNLNQKKDIMIQPIKNDSSSSSSSTVLPSRSQSVSCDNNSDESRGFSRNQSQRQDPKGLAMSSSCEQVSQTHHLLNHYNSKNVSKGSCVVDYHMPGRTPLGTGVTDNKRSPRAHVQQHQLNEARVQANLHKQLSSDNYQHQHHHHHNPGMENHPNGADLSSYHHQSSSKLNHSHSSWANSSIANCSMPNLTSPRGHKTSPSFPFSPPDDKTPTLEPSKSYLDDDTPSLSQEDPPLDKILSVDEEENSKMKRSNSDPSMVSQWAKQQQIPEWQREWTPITSSDPSSDPPANQELKKSPPLDIWSGFKN